MIIFVIIILILCLILMNQYKEKFNTNKIEFLGKDSSCKILKKINYSYNDLDLKLRNIPKEFHKSIYKFYCDYLLDFNELDKKLLMWIIDAMKLKLPSNLLFIFDTIKFSKFQNNIENGYPHTNYNVIYLTDSFIYRLLDYYNNNDIDSAIIDIGSVIIHECVHIWQRKNESGFKDLYINYWKFIKPNKIYNSERLDTLKRYNPDGVDTKWVFSLNGKHIYILSIYHNNSRNIGDVKFIGIYVERNGNNCIIPDSSKEHDLSSIKEFNGFFKHLNGNHYHPNEISAELLSIYYLKVMKVSHQDYSNIGYKNMLVWLNTQLT